MVIGDWLKRMKYVLVSGSLDQNVDEVIYDSRKARPDSVFVCIQGLSLIHIYRKRAGHQCGEPPERDQDLDLELPHTDLYRGCDRKPFLKRRMTQNRI